MKTTQVLKTILVLTSLGSAGLSIAQDTLMQETDSILNSEQIDIDGVYAPRKQTAAEKLAKMRKNLEKKNEQMVQTKIEDMRVDSETKLTKKLSKAFSGGLAADQVVTKTSAVQKSEAKVEAPKKRKKSKVIPMGGLKNYQGEYIDLSSDVSLGLAIETDVSPRFSLGLEVGYSNMTMLDVGNSYLGNNYNQNQSFYNVYGYNYNNYYANNNNYGQNYYGAYGQQGREMSYSALGFNLTGKFFFIAESMIRPYIGVAAGVNRAKVKYKENNSYQYESTQFGNESYSSNNFVGHVMMGAEVNFTETIGANLSVRYSKALTTSNEAYGVGLENPDQVRLKNIGQVIEEADVVSLDAGMIIKF